MKKTIKYYYFLSKHRGERYFAIIFLDKLPIYAIQVCLDPGELKRGRAHNFGIIKMSYISVMGNYAFDCDFRMTSKVRYNNAFKKVKSMLYNSTLKP